MANDKEDVADANKNQGVADYAGGEVPVVDSGREPSPEDQTTARGMTYRNYQRPDGSQMEGGASIDTPISPEARAARIDRVVNAAPPIGKTVAERNAALDNRPGALYAERASRITGGTVVPEGGVLPSQGTSPVRNHPVNVNQETAQVESAGSGQPGHRPIAGRAGTRAGQQASPEDYDTIPGSTVGKLGRVSAQPGAGEGVATAGRLSALQGWKKVHDDADQVIKTTQPGTPENSKAWANKITAQEAGHNILEQQNKGNAEWFASKLKGFQNDAARDDLPTEWRRFSAQKVKQYEAEIATLGQEKLATIAKTGKDQAEIIAQTVGGKTTPNVPSSFVAPIKYLQNELDPEFQKDPKSMVAHGVSADNIKVALNKMISDHQHAQATVFNHEIEEVERSQIEDAHRSVNANTKGAEIVHPADSESKALGNVMSYIEARDKNVAVNAAAAESGDEAATSALTPVQLAMAQKYSAVKMRKEAIEREAKEVASRTQAIMESEPWASFMVRAMVSGGEPTAKIIAAVADMRKRATTGKEGETGLDKAITNREEAYSKLMNNLGKLRELGGRSKENAEEFDLATKTVAANRDAANRAEAAFLSKRAEQRAIQEGKSVGEAAKDAADIESLPEPKDVARQMVKGEKTAFPQLATRASSMLRMLGAFNASNLTDSDRADLWKRAEGDKLNKFSGLIRIVSKMNDADATAKTGLTMDQIRDIQRVSELLPTARKDNG